MAIGRSDVFLKLEIIKKTLSVLVIVSTFRLGVFTWMAISAFLLGPLSVIINAWPNKKLLDYTIGMQIRDVLPTALVCIAEAGAVLGVDLAWSCLMPYRDVDDSGGCLIAFLICKLALQFVFGAGVFLGLAYFFRLDPLREYIRMGTTILLGRYSRFAAVIERRFT